jgi:hypothetical protein
MKSRISKLILAAVVAIAIGTPILHQTLHQGDRSSPSKATPTSERKEGATPPRAERTREQIIADLRRVDPNIIFGIEDVKRQLNEISPSNKNANYIMGGKVDLFLELSPNEAVEWVLSKPATGMYQSAYREMGLHTGKQGYDQVSQILERLNPDQKLCFAKGVVNGLGFSSPMHAFELKNRMEKETGIRYTYGNHDMLMNAVEGGKIEEAIFAVQTFVPEKYEQITDLSNLYAYWARTAPEQAAEDLFTRSYPKETERIVLQALLRQWSNPPSYAEKNDSLKEWMRKLEPDRLSLAQQELKKIASRK